MESKREKKLNTVLDGDMNQMKTFGNNQNKTRKIKGQKKNAEIKLRNISKRHNVMKLNVLTISRGCHKRVKRIQTKFSQSKMFDMKNACGKFLANFPFQAVYSI